MIASIFLMLLAPVLLAATYLFLLTLCSAQPRIPPAAKRPVRFLTVVPAHDEAAGIAKTVHSLLALHWPKEQHQVLVIADNCRDDTAAIARDAGARVVERQDATLRGKGFALQRAYELALAEGWADALVVVDADTDVDLHLLESFAARIAQGACALQAYYSVRNPEASWRTRLLTIALALFHRVRGRARENLGVSAGLRGNGMCFTIDTLRKVPHAAFSIVEDLEYGVDLGRAGIRVWYTDEAQVRADMVVSDRAAQSQRQRWEGGRFAFARQHGPALVGLALRRPSGLLFDLVADILVPPLGYVVFAAGALALIGAILAWAGAVSATVAVIGALPLLMLFLHIARGVSLSGFGLRGWGYLVAAPFYVLWKISLLLRNAAVPKSWVRTTREP